MGEDEPMDARRRGNQHDHVLPTLRLKYLRPPDDGRVLEADSQLVVPQTAAQVQIQRDFTQRQRVTGRTPTPKETRTISINKLVMIYNAEKAHADLWSSRKFPAHVRVHAFRF